MIAFETHRIPMVPVADGGLPIIDFPQPPIPATTTASLGEEPGRPLCPRPRHLLPYTSQSRYGRTPELTDTPVAVLENARLRATFLLDLGGRLWSLYDKDADRELLFQPDAVQVGNLALRDAWFSGGIEWNLGATGHWGLTCEPVCAGAVGDVLRLWAFERLTRLVWRVEATLDDDRLLVGVRLHSPHDEPVPLYWWSNTAVPIERCRVLADATSSWWHNYSHELGRVPWPREAPEQASDASDYFIEIAAPWQAAVGADGYGLLEQSTPELHGRKLFVWGDGVGGRTWQRWLNGTGRYVEIQAGYARTQFEHVRLDPGATVTWVEAYGPTRVGPGEPPPLRPLPDPFGPLADTAPAVWRADDAWGRLEVAAAHMPHDPATPFDGDDDDWLAFLASGQLADALADRPVTGARWLTKLAAADESWVQQLLYGYALWADDRRSDAVAAWHRSVELQPNPQALRALALASEDGWDRFDFIERAWQLDGRTPELLVEYLTAAAAVPTLVLRIVAGLHDDLREHPRVRLAECRALLETGQVEAAESILDAPLVLPNLREGDADLTEVWALYQGSIGRDDPLPPHYDFRMH